MKLELKKPYDKRQILASASPDGNFYTFASDKNKAYCLRYNSALFFRDSLSMNVPDSDAFAAGSSFDSGGAYLYWQSQNHDKLWVTGFDFQKRQSSKNAYTFSFEKETYLGSFSNDGIFYLLTVFDEEQKLKIRTFHNGNPQEQVVDLSNFEIIDRQDKKLKLFKLFEQSPLQIIAPGSFPSLTQTASATKLFYSKGQILFTFDMSPNFTQVFSISTADFSVTETRFAQPSLTETDASSANSFVIDSLLVQIRVSSSELVLESKKLEKNASVLKQYRVETNQVVDFKNSPLLVQNGNRKPFELSSTKKFLSRLDGSQPAVSAYATPQGILLNCGGVREIPGTGGIILGTIGLGVAITGNGSFDPDSLYDSKIPQVIYFESLFDANFAHSKKEQNAIAFDFLSTFLSENESIVTYSLSLYNKAQILAYYDSRSKMIILRKFQEESPEDNMFGN
ncbi:hypothetical protein [Flavobacterium sp.]|uniref:hypothetical protein n=1 Tax=Flavobacterium sp. TaxID=239 RepID=UPI001205C31B|nr:hypothetical protein [Flavobacterium sp.]RZJ73222.1 MAG: hypothetical protein EOO49_02640 [Flavobacterium sp.]